MRSTSSKIRSNGRLGSLLREGTGLRGLVRVGSLVALCGFAGPAALAQQSQAPQPAQAASSAAALAAQLRAVIASDTTPFAVGHTDFRRYTTPGYCLAAVRHAITLGRSTIAAQEALDTVRRDAAHDTLPARVTAVARACAARFPVATASAPELPHLFQLAVLAAQDTLAEAVLARRLAQAKGPGAQAALLADAVTTYLAAEPARVAAAEVVLARLDALGASAAAVPSRLRAHQALLAAADSTGDEPRVRREASTILALTRAAAATNPSESWEMVEAYKTLIRLAYVHAPDSVPILVRQLQQDTRTFPNLQYAQLPMDTVMRRLSPVGEWPGLGQPTPVLRAAFWLPAPGQTQDTMLPQAGRVSLFVEIPAVCYAYTGGSLETPLDPIGSGCQRIYNLIRRWRTQYGSKFDLTAVVAATGTMAVLLTGPEPAANTVKRLQWYVFDYLKLPVNRLAVQLLPMTAPLPAPDGRIFVTPLVDGNPSAPPQLMDWSQTLGSAYLGLLPFEQVYHPGAYRQGSDPGLVLTGPDGRCLYSGAPSAVFDALFARALASQPQTPTSMPAASGASATSAVGLPTSPARAMIGGTRPPVHALHEPTLFSFRFLPVGTP